MGPPSLPGVGARGRRTEGLVGYTPEEGAVWTPGWEAVLSRVRMYRSAEKAEEALGQAPRGSLHRLWNKEAEPPPGLPWSGEEGRGGEATLRRRRRSTNRYLQDSHRDVENSSGNAVNNIVITVPSARWVLG